MRGTFNGSLNLGNYVAVSNIKIKDDLSIAPAVSATDIYSIRVRGYGWTASMTSAQKDA